MNCILLFHFVLLLISITLLILSISTSRWIVYSNKNSIGTVSEQSIGIIVICQQFYRQNNVDLHPSINNTTSNDKVYTCFNRLFKWYNSSINGPELLHYHKALIVISFGCVFITVISLILTQFINTEASFYKIRLSKRIVDCLLIANILSVILALIVLILFFGFEHLQNLQNYGYSFWLFIIGTCCIFLCSVLISVFRIDVEFEFRRFRHESIATLC